MQIYYEFYFILIPQLFSTFSLLVFSHGHNCKINCSNISCRRHIQNRDSEKLTEYHMGQIGVLGDISINATISMCISKFELNIYIFS